MKNKLDYTGKNIFLGIDVHKKTYSIAVICEGILMKRDTITAKPEKLGMYLKKYFTGAKIKSAYEAGFSGYVLLCEIVNTKTFFYAQLWELMAFERHVLFYVYN